MDDALQSELRALQARAYGPGDGLAGNDAARRRLTELEERARRESDRPPVIDGAPEPAFPLSPRPEVPPLPSVSPADAAHAFATSPGEPDRALHERRRRRLRGLAWVGSLAMVATLAVGVTAAATSRQVWTAASVPPGTTITHVATLMPDADRGWPETYGERPRDGAIFEPLGSVTPIVGSMPTGDGLTRCVQLLPPEAWEPTPDEGWAWGGYGGCSVEPFTATATFVVGPNSPSDLRERFAEGVRLQFVAGDGVVDVYSADAPVSEATR
ncbi:hypothetical protein ACIGEP_12495 [Microbacterium sp. NPDC077663]|uniref:hypothetical protein n=1 Tax=Microbacterium sp. NPDC077663 TaxID=3364189 RepID=UPI0037CB3185